MKIPGYTLHGDYYLADKVIPNKNWNEACKIIKEITLPNGKTVIARTLSKAELETIPQEQREISENGHVWYWTSTPDSDMSAWFVNFFGDFSSLSSIYNNYDDGGARLGFHKNETKQLLDAE